MSEVELTLALVKLMFVSPGLPDGATSSCSSLGIK